MKQNTPKNPYNSPEANLRQTMNTPTELKHSGLGIASFIMSLICGLGLFVIVFIASMMSLNGEMDETSSAAMIIGLAMFVFLGLEFIALILGIVGWTQKDRKSVFGILGTVFSAVVIVGMIGLIAIGLTIG